MSSRIPRRHGYFLHIKFDGEQSVKKEPPSDLSNNYFLRKYLKICYIIPSAEYHLLEINTSFSMHNAPIHFLMEFGLKEWPMTTGSWSLYCDKCQVSGIRSWAMNLPNLLLGPNHKGETVHRLMSFKGKMTYIGGILRLLGHALTYFVISTFVVRTKSGTFIVCRVAWGQFFKSW